MCYTYLQIIFMHKKQTLPACIACRTTRDRRETV
jgi:hypothetical protein